jgi:peptide/nickel transport system permease protein
VFAWPGVGRLLVEAVYTRDYPVVQAAVFVTALFVATCNLLTDLLYAYLDPRIRYG